MPFRYFLKPNKANWLNEYRTRKPQLLMITRPLLNRLVDKALSVCRGAIAQIGSLAQSIAVLGESCFAVKATEV